MPEPSLLRRKPLIAAVLVFMVAALCALGLISTLERKDREQLRTQVADLAGDHAQALQRGIEQALSANSALVALVRQGQGNVEKFEEIGQAMLPFYPGITALGLSPDGVVRHVVPVAGNQSLVGFDQLNDLRQGLESRRAVDSGLLTLAGPFELVQGGLGVVGRQPVYLEDSTGQRRFWGFTFVTIRLTAVVDHARLPQLAERGFHYRLWRQTPGSRQEQTISQSSRPPGPEAVTRTLLVPNGQWMLTLAPINGWEAHDVLALRLGLGLVFALLMAYLAWLLVRLQEHQRGLAFQVAKRTGEIEAAQHQLQATIDAIPDPLFELDQDGRYCAIHTQRRELLMAPEAQLLGRTVHEVLPAVAAQTVMEALRDAQLHHWSIGRQIALEMAGQGVRWFELSVARKTTAGPASPRFIVLARDISERKRTQEQLQLTAQVFDQSSEAIVIADCEQRIVRINRAFTRTTGYSEEEAVGQPIHLFTSADRAETADSAALARWTQPGHWEGEAWGQRKNGERYPQWLSISNVADTSHEVMHSITLFRDITAQREAQEHIQRLAHYDHLTALPNRALLAERASHWIDAEKSRGGSLAMLFLDLDHFKNVNDSLGHRVGDALLVSVARKLEALLGPNDTVARLGGDEFLLLLPGATPARAAEVAALLLEQMAQPVQTGDYELSTTLSVGIAMFPADGATFDMLYQRADAAMYRAKQSGRNRYGFFTADLEARSARALRIENALRRALERQQLELHYQPQVRLSDGKLLGAEALLRWNHPELGAVSPVEFIPVAESSGLIVSIGEWVLQTAVRDAKRWLDANLPLRTVSVNLSAVQFRHAQLPDMVARSLRETGLPARRLELELTEGAAVDDPVAALGIMEQLSDLGVRLSMDDFGTGYSSLSYLKKFQIYKLKIDQSFVRDLEEDANDRAIVAAIIRMAQALGMETTAEGVETEGQLEFLRAHGCDDGQGYLFSRPLPTAAFEQFLRAQQEIAPAQTPENPEAPSHRTSSND